MRAESSLAFQPSGKLEAVGATTFDVEGNAVGESSFQIETDPEGNQLMRITLSIEGGGSNISQATLGPAIAGAADSAQVGSRGLRLLEERSQATTAAGDVYPLLVIDHRRGRVSCYPDGQDSAEGKHVDIEGEDRVVNVPMQLLFLPLVRGEVEALRFQIATCVDVPVLHRMIAVRSGTNERNGREVIEIKYGPDLGRTVAYFASRLLPSFSFWFDASDGQYLGHRMPLHRKGPEILLVRHGLKPPDIGVE